MTKAELASMIDAYADAKTSGNKYLVKKMIEDLEAALDEVCDDSEVTPGEMPKLPYDLPPATPTGGPTVPTEPAESVSEFEY